MTEGETCQFCRTKVRICPTEFRLRCNCVGNSGFYVHYNNQGKPIEQKRRKTLSEYLMDGVTAVERERAGSLSAASVGVSE